MAFRLYDLPEIEPSRYVGFAGNRIDRLSEKRRDDSAFSALELPETRLMLLGGNRMLLDYAQEKSPCALPPRRGKGFCARSERTDPARYSGRCANRRPDDTAGPGGAGSPSPGAGLSQHLYRRAVIHRSRRRAGAGRSPHRMARQPSFLRTLRHQNRNARGGAKRQCPNCGAEHFPRTDPVAIMLPVRGEKCILARGPHFAPGSYSSLAGFIEHGETIEAAVRRESFEEMGLAIGRVAYHASQPWPFPIR